jgi:hypothetical protein
MTSGLFGHFIHDANDSVQATPEWQGDNIPTVGSNFSNPSYSSRHQADRNADAPRCLLEAAFNYDGNKIAIIPVAAEGGNFVKPSGWSTQTYFAPNERCGQSPARHQWKNDGGADWGPGNDPWTNGAEDFAEVFGLSCDQGKHQMKFGGGYNRYTKNQVIGKDSEGDYTFDGWKASSVGGQLTGDSYLGLPARSGHQLQPGERQSHQPLREQTISAYAQDNWHVNSQVERAVWLPLRLDAARMGTQQPGFQL